MNKTQQKLPVDNNILVRLQVILSVDTDISK